MCYSLILSMPNGELRPLFMGLTRPYGPTLLIGLIKMYYRPTSHALVMRLNDDKTEGKKGYSSLKGQSHEIFDPRFFSPIKSPYVTDYHPKIFSNSVLISPRYREFVSTPRRTYLHIVCKIRKQIFG
jgi:hypothetical protein